MKLHLVILALLSLSIVTGCAVQRPAAEPTKREISSAEAVHTARLDAANRFRLEDVSINVSRAGRYWVVDLRGPGGGLHYAIATDGSIRERQMIQ